MFTVGTAVLSLFYAEGSDLMSMNALNNGISIDKPPIVTLQTGAVALLTLAVTTLLAFCAEKVKKSSHIS